MTTSSRRSFAAVLCLGACMALGLARAQAQGLVEAPTLESVLARFAQVEALSVHFKEEKRMALLTVPLVSEGDIYYQKPRLLARHTTSPSKSSLVLKGKELSFGDAKRHESMAVDTHPAVRVLVDTFVAVLAGDQQRLLAMAHVSLERVGERGFRIVVLPRDESVKKLVQRMAFEGEGSTLKSMELIDANGDRSVTTFSQVRPRKRFTQDEENKLFRLGS